jgi:two-component system KDP operon response regulator KdpE
MRILIVDDEPAICRALQIAFKRWGYEVDATESGENALRLLQCQAYDGMVIDLHVPDLRGDVLFELAASLQPQLRERTVFITGDSSPRALRLLEACGGPILPKPFDLYQLRTLIDGMRRTQEEVRGAS